MPMELILLHIIGASFSVFLASVWGISQIKLTSY
jgi:hypothetical protein